MKLTVGALTLVALLLSGCAYQPKEDEPTARLRVVTYTSATTSFHAYDMTACPKSSRMILLVLSELHSASETRLDMLGAAEPDSKRSTETYIPARGRLPMMLSVTVSNPPLEHSCRVGVVFDPIRDAQYELQFRYEGNRCGALLYKLSKEESGKVLRSREVTASGFRIESGMNMCTYK